MSRWYGSLIVGVAGLLLSAPAHADYTACSLLPNLTGQPASVVNIPVKRSSQSAPSLKGEHPAQPDLFSFTITGKDLDTYKDRMGGATIMFVDSALVCSKVSEEYPTISGPSFRGVAEDGTATWDITGTGTVVSTGTTSTPARAKVFINTYKLGNDASSSGPRSSMLNDPPVYVQQILRQAAR